MKFLIQVRQFIPEDRISPGDPRGEIGRAFPVCRDFEIPPSYIPKILSRAGRKFRARRKPCTVLVLGKHWWDTSFSVLCLPSVKRAK
jgi:hypothetical protein